MTHFNFILSTNISTNTRAIKKIKNLNKVMWSYKIEKGQLIRNVDSNHQRALKGWCVIQGDSEGITDFMTINHQLWRRQHENNHMKRIKHDGALSQDLSRWSNSLNVTSGFNKIIIILVPIQNSWGRAAQNPIF